MKILKGIILPEYDPPMRGYLLDKDLHVFGKSPEERVIYAFKSIKKAFSNHERTLKKHDFIITAAYGHTTEKWIDFYCFNFKGDWPGESEIDRFIIKNSSFERLSKNVEPMPGDMAIILGSEEEFRKKSRDFKKYINNGPLISDSGKILEYLVDRR